MITRILTTAALALGSAAALAQAQTNQPRNKFEYWYGLPASSRGDGRATAAASNAGQTRFERSASDRAAMIAPRQNTIAAFRARQHPTNVQYLRCRHGQLHALRRDLQRHPVRQRLQHEDRLEDYFPGISSYYATSKGE